MMIFFDALLINKNHDKININDPIIREKKIIDIHVSILIMCWIENINTVVNNITITDEKIGFKKNVFFNFIMCAVYKGKKTVFFSVNTIKLAKAIPYSLKFKVDARIIAKNKFKIPNPNEKKPGILTLLNAEFIENKGSTARLIERCPIIRQSKGLRWIYSSPTHKVNSSEENPIIIPIIIPINIPINLMDEIEISFSFLK